MNTPLAIASTNKDKYSETFIHNHVKLLPGNMHILFDGYLPHCISADKLRSFKYISRKAAWLKRIGFEKQSKKVLVHSISNYLRSNHVSTVLAEYGPSGVEMMPICQSIKIPLVVHFHGYDAYRMDILSSYGKRYWELFQFATAVIAVSQHMMEQLSHLGCPPEKLHYLPYGINNKIFYDQLTSRKPQLVSCGRFVEKKGQILTIRAFKPLADKYKEAHLILIGDGTLRAQCEWLVQELGLPDRVTFTGILSQEEIANLFNESMIYVQHSIRADDHDMEGTPLAILEAGACGLPVVATRHGGIFDVLEDGENGFLVDEHDVDSMSERLFEIFENPWLAVEMGRKLAKKVNQHYRLEDYTSKLGKILEISTQQF